MKNLLVGLLICCSLLCGFPVISQGTEFVEDDLVVEEELYENFVIFDEFDNFLTEKRGVQLGDLIIDSNFNKYEVYFVDDEHNLAKARFLEKLEKPKIHKTQMEQVANITLDKTLGLYSTHNDESYIVGDGTESVYGAGGIHDIAKLLAKSLKTKGIDVVHDETLHIPHNSSAYSRSRTTANKLLQNGANAIFDIHRDGASRSFYLTSNNGKKYSKVRIVVGQGNANKDANLQLALWMTSVAETLYLWLIADIYYGSGKYNQDLTSKALLFEMGCHQIEKEYVKNSVPALADVIYTTLFCTTVNENGNLVIGSPKVDETKIDKEAKVDENLTIEEVLENIDENNAKNNSIWWVLGLSFSVIVVGVIIFVVLQRIKYEKNKKTHN